MQTLCPLKYEREIYDNTGSMKEWYLECKGTPKHHSHPSLDPSWIRSSTKPLLAVGYKFENYSGKNQKISLSS